ncbi:MAG: GTP pyrophosphokinase [Eubacteriales bacterium SKADARSKE-1]|nr:GTP pyrophosphokinase [Eubacteriales bacterium SKADARSKE-1]
MEGLRRSFYKNYEQLIELLNKNGYDFNMDLIDKAYRLALTAHESQKRVSGIPYILHPTSVACILAELGMDTESIVAALLHDIVEDTDVSLGYIEKSFGPDIANLVDGVTKLGKIPYSSKEEQQAENVRKMLIAMSEDIRVIIIKLADRLHNMRTIECMDPQKRRDKARENMEVYAPIAHRLGIRTIKEELEDLSLKYLDPIAYKEIQEALNLKKIKREQFINSIKETLKEKLIPFIPEAHLEGRVKSINGIYRKMFVKHCLMEEIYDIYAVRVIVDTVNDCYNALGIIHDAFTPIPNRFKDYISTPKPNMYQSLHTTVIGRDGIPFEVQIRTWEMHRTAEYGIAAHWKYKLGLKGGQTDFEQQLSWIKNMIENQVDSEDAIDLMRTIKSDLVPEEVFVLTPRGDVINLPLGATVIDFAYAIHSEVGNHMIGAKVDKRIVPFEFQVKTGQIIEILTTKEKDKGPSRGWLNIVKTSEARNKIRQWFKKERREENITNGRLELEREIRRMGMELSTGEVKELLKNIAKKQRCESTDKLYEAIGYGGIQLWRIAPKIKLEYSKIRKLDKPIEIKEKPISQRKKVQKGVVVEGIDNCLVRFSKCCNPIPGDEIVGFITRGYGVSIHKKNCLNVPIDIENSSKPERWVKVHWLVNEEEFRANIKIVANDFTGLLAEITSLFSSLNVSIHALNSTQTKNNKAVIYATLTVKNTQHLNLIISKVLQSNKIISVTRV